MAQPPLESEGWAIWVNRYARGGGGVGVGEGGCERCAAAAVPTPTNRINAEMFAIDRKRICNPF